jgi:D-alanyl-D-alanine carboxypeptidase (penicillin-binding protein 5/6)
VEDLIKATAIYSANNAAYSLAYYVSDGDVEKFVENMNEKARELGMENTTYYTPTGLPPHMTGTGMDVSTAEDVYILSMKVLENEEYMRIASMKEASIRNGEQSFYNRNKLLGIKGINGIKTGHHDAAGYNISISFDRDGDEYIEVVLGSPDEDTRNNLVLEDIDKFYKNYEKRKILSTSTEIGKIKIKYGNIGEIKFYEGMDLEKMLPKTAKITKEVMLAKKVEAPIKKGTVVGVYNVYIDNQLQFRKELRIPKDIEKVGFFKRIFM